MIENSRKQKSQNRNNSLQNFGSNDFSVYRKGRRTSIAIEGESNSTPTRKTAWKCSHPQGSRRTLKSKNNGYDFCNNCKSMVKSNLSSTDNKLKLIPL